VAALAATNREDGEAEAEPEGHASQQQDAAAGEGGQVSLLKPQATKTKSALYKNFPKTDTFL
jgi:hypothetical protein